MFYLLIIEIRCILLCYVLSKGEVGLWVCLHSHDIIFDKILRKESEKQGGKINEKMKKGEQRITLTKTERENDK